MFYSVLTCWMPSFKNQAFKFKSFRVYLTLNVGGISSLTWVNTQKSTYFLTLMIGGHGWINAQNRFSVWKTFSRCTSCDVASCRGRLQLLYTKQRQTLYEICRFLHFCFFIEESFDHNHLGSHYFKLVKSKCCNVTKAVLSKKLCPKQSLHRHCYNRFFFFVHVGMTLAFNHPPALYCLFFLYVLKIYVKNFYC